jgi:NAD-dependent deacetylase
LSSDIEQAAQWIRESKVTVALTGAGISVDSGIPDFRSPGGLWEKFDPMEYGTIWAFQSNPIKVWMMLAEMEGVIAAAGPNAGHAGLAELERLGLLAAIITQNIDNLHQAAGNTRVIEFHGNWRRLVCMTCGSMYDAQHFRGMTVEDENFPPRCEKCDAILKPDVILFGEQIPLEASHDSHELASRCRVMIVVGTSAEVYPAADLPFLAKSRGAKIIEINIEKTHISRGLADIALTGSASVVIPELVEAVRDAK